MAKGDGVATWSLVCGIIAIVLGLIGGGVRFIPVVGICACFISPFAFILACTAIILGIIGLVSGNKSAKTKSIVGIVLGVCYFFLGITLFVLGLVFATAIGGLGSLGDIIIL
ncbi:MAG: hypothetical protein QCI82_08735 [Candidatus Thermoplasmatota archaeon]|nr:hypothetical protein [Candidatus Thermoplasmatota archaeon]